VWALIRVCFPTQLLVLIAAMIMDHVHFCLVRSVITVVLDLCLAFQDFSMGTMVREAIIVIFLTLEVIHALVNTPAHILQTEKALLKLEIIAVTTSLHALI